MMNYSKQDESFMRRALALAREAEKKGEVPVGAVIVLNDEIIGEGFNSPIGLRDPSAHAEIIALREAGQHQHNYRLPGTTLYVTLEPCMMCVGAMIHARLARVVFGAPDPKTGAAGGVVNLFISKASNHSVVCEGGLLAEESSALLRAFFQAKRSE